MLKKWFYRKLRDILDKQKIECYISINNSKQVCMIPEDHMNLNFGKGSNALINVIYRGNDATSIMLDIDIYIKDTPDGRYRLTRMEEAGW